MKTHGLTTPSSFKRGWLLRGFAAMLAFATLAVVPMGAQAGVFVSVSIAPPALPVYVQPAIPGAGYIWAPGYWAYADGGYYWVPGTWVLAPYVGALWTPGYWGWAGGFYVFQGGYWGRHVGFYGGINYGFGYGGVGYEGGYWGNGGFYYNRSVTHVTNNITNVYNRTVINNTTINNRTSFNGGTGGVMARPTAQETAYSREQRTDPVAAQKQQMAMASRNPSLRAAVNHGAPPIAATPRAGAFDGRGAVAAKGATRDLSAAAAQVQRTGAGPAMTQRANRSAMRSASFAPHGDAAMRAERTQRSSYAPSSMNQREGLAPANGMRDHQQASSSRYSSDNNHAPAYQQQARPVQHQAASRPQHAPAPAVPQKNDKQRHGN